MKLASLPSGTSRWLQEQDIDQDMMHRNAAGLLAVLLVLTGCATSGKEDIHRVGIVNGVPLLFRLEDHFKTRMTELGYVEGQTIEYVMRDAFDGREQEIAMVDEIVESGIDVLVSMPTEVSLIAKEKARQKGIPLVFSNAVTEEVPLIESIRSPGEGITGVRYPGPDLVVLRFETLRQLVPDVRHVLIPYLEGYPIVPSQLAALRPVAAGAGVELVEAPVPNGKAMQAHLDALFESGQPQIDAIILITDPISVDADAIAALERFAAACRIPIAGIFPDATPHTLFALMIELDRIGRQTADLVDKILRGTPAGHLPVISGDINLGVNLRTAALLDITVPESVLSHAEKIIH